MIDFGKCINAIDWHHPVSKVAYGPVYLVDFTLLLFDNSAFTQNILPERSREYISIAKVLSQQGVTFLELKNKQKKKMQTELLF